MRYLLAGILSIIFASSAQAADRTGEFAIKGAGVQTCASLTRAWDAKSTDLNLYAGWIDGYLTGMNQHTDGTFDVAPWQSSMTLLALVSQMCQQNNADTRFIDVFNQLMRDFMPARLTDSSSVSAVRRGDMAVVLYNDTITRLQRRLTEEGFAPGEADGNFDDQTAAALEKFQAGRGLPLTGFPDQQTLFALFVENAG